MTEASPATRGEATRERLIEVAHKLFLKRGFHGTSMRQIAQAAGLAVGGIYNHFASKEDIFAAVLDAHHPYHVVIPALDNTQGETVEAFMRSAAEQLHAETAHMQARLLPLMFTELVEFQGRHLQDLAGRLVPTILTFLQRFSERPGQALSLPPMVVMRTFVALMIGYWMTEIVVKNSPVFKSSEHDWFGGMVDIYLHGILGKPASSQAAGQARGPEA